RMRGATVECSRARIPRARPSAARGFRACNRLLEHYGRRTMTPAAFPRRLRALALAVALLNLAGAVRAQLDYASPEVRPDQRVILRLHAPSAQAVAVHGIHGVGTTPLTRDSGGLWSVTLGPLPADIYSYWFEVDGARVLD